MPILLVGDSEMVVEGTAGFNILQAVDALLGKEDRGDILHLHPDPVEARGDG